MGCSGVDDMAVVVMMVEEGEDDDDDAEGEADVKENGIEIEIGKEKEGLIDCGRND